MGAGVVLNCFSTLCFLACDFRDVTDYSIRLCR